MVFDFCLSPIITYNGLKSFWEAQSSFPVDLTRVFCSGIRLFDRGLPQSKRLDQPLG